MKIAIGSDHAGFAVKEAIRQSLKQQAHDVADFGAYNDKSCDYPDFALAVAREVSQGRAERGILICGSGIGMAIAANKVPGIRAVVCGDTQNAEMSRRHNDCNVLCLGARIISEAVCQNIVQVWLQTKFEGGRHQGRVDKITAMEHKICQGGGVI